MSSTSTEPGAVRIALALVAACTTATALYALVRLGQSLLFKEPNPALVIWSEHAGFFWRGWIVSYAGGMAGLMTWLGTARSSRQVAQVLVTAIPASAALLFLQSLLVP